MSARRVGVVAVLFLLSIALAAAFGATPGPSVWMFEKHSSGTWGGPYFRAGEVRAFCDGPHRVYVGRMADGDAGSLSLAVIRDGCLSGPAEDPRGK